MLDLPRSVSRRYWPSWRRPDFAPDYRLRAPSTSARGSLHGRRREEKYKAKSLIDTFVYRLGDILGAWSYPLMRWFRLGLVASPGPVPLEESGAVLAFGWAANSGARRERGRQVASSRCELRLNENPKQRTVRWRFRAKIADEPIFRPDLDMAGCAIGIVDQDRTHRRLIRIVHRQLSEAIVID